MTDLSDRRNDFPTLLRSVHGDTPLTYLDNAATSQKPRRVIDAVSRYYADYNANVHRGMHALAEEATAAYEEARTKLATFFNAPSRNGVIFTRGTTESLNLFANTWAATTLQPGDEILISVMEHHSNIVPWQLVAQRTGAVVKFIPMTADGDLDQQAFEELLSSKTKLLSVAQVSNALGTIHPVKEMIAKAKALGVTCVVDGAQSAPHMPVDVQDLGCDMYACSGHKMCGPTGIGALIASEELLDAMPPFLGGGEMIDRVTLDGSTWADLPYKFEAGTPNMAGAIGWGEAIDYLSEIGMDQIEASVASLVQDAEARLEAEEGVRLTAHPAKRSGAVSFWLGDLHPHDVSQIVDQSGVAIRAGHMCCQPLMEALNCAAINRASYHFYNTTEDTDRLIESLRIVRRIFG